MVIYIREDGTGNSWRTIDGLDEVYDGGINLRDLRNLRAQKTI